MARQDRQTHPAGWRVFGTCTAARNCCNPRIMVCEPVAVQGQKVAASGKLKGNIRRITANRKTGPIARGLDAETRQAVRQSEESGLALAERRAAARRRSAAFAIAGTWLFSRWAACLPASWPVPHDLSNLRPLAAKDRLACRYGFGRCKLEPPPFDRAREFSANAACNKGKHAQATQTVLDARIKALKGPQC